jgi:hypothetical protein
MVKKFTLQSIDYLFIVILSFISTVMGYSRFSVNLLQ